MRLCILSFLLFFFISCDTDNNKDTTITDEEIVNILIRDYIDTDYPCRLPSPKKGGVCEYDSVEFRKNNVCTVCFKSKSNIEIDKLSSQNYLIKSELSCTEEEDMYLTIWRIYRCDCNTNEVFVYFSVTKKHSYTIEEECFFKGREYTSETISSSVH